MKKLLSIILLLVYSIVWAGEFTGAGSAVNLLRGNNIALDKNDKILLGEFTGAGKVVPFNKLKVVMSKNQVILLKKAKHIEFNSHKDRYELKDIKYIQEKDKLIYFQDIKAVVVKGEKQQN